MLTRLARVSFHHRRLVAAAWVLALVLARDGGFRTRRRLRDQRSPVRHRLAGRVRHAGGEFPQRHGDEGQIVFADISQETTTRSTYLAKVAKGGASSRSSRSKSRRGKDRVAPITTASGHGAHPLVTADDIKDLAKPLEDRVSTSSSRAPGSAKPGMPASEIVGIIAAIIVLLIAFGSLITMGLPILTALIGIAISLAGVGILANVFTTPDFTPGRRDDRARSRYRLRPLHRHPLPRGIAPHQNNPEVSVVEAMTTSGRAVVFAGFTVMVSLLGMLLMGLNFLHGLAVGTSFAVVVAVLAAITLLPALLGFVGFTIDKFKVGRRKPRTRQGVWHRWARFVQRRPGRIAFVGFESC